MFEYNDNDLEVEVFNNSNIYTIKNFFKTPDRIVELIQKTDVELWKFGQSKNNGTVFEDKRHTFKNNSIGDIQTKLSLIVKQKPYILNEMYSNYFIMKDKSFNDYHNNYWWPHKDIGYTAIIYLNDFEFEGTNLYESLEYDDTDNMNEHEKPWRSNCKYRVAKTIKSEYNKLVLFDGLKFLHGMAIINDVFFVTKRMNVVMFFDGKS